MSNGHVIARGGLNLRKSPKTGKVLKSLRRGSNVEILEEETWLRVKTRDGNEGYVLSDYIEREEVVLADHRDGADIQVTDVFDLLALAKQEQNECLIKTYTNSQFIGKEIRADVDFLPHLDRLNQYAADCEVKIYVASSTREPGRSVSGNIVPPASRSNHLVGHVIDMNFQSENGFYNSKKLKKSRFNRLPDEIRALINLIRDDEILRWGGDFRREDPVHIDDNLSRRNRQRWDMKFASRQ